MKLVWDLEATGLLDHTSLEYSIYPFRLKNTFKIHCIVFKDIETGKKYRFYKDSLTKENVEGILSKATKIIAHNGIQYDLPVIFLYFGVDYHVGSGGEDCDTVLGKPCEIVDTLLESRVLWPDRPSGHSLKEWGKRLGVYKGDYGEQENAWEEFSEEMLEYCEQDVDVTEKVYLALQEEKGDWPWQKAMDMEKAIAEIIFRQEHFGFGFNKELAEKALEDLNQKMQDIEDKVEPQLPKKNLGKTEAKKYIPPKVQVKQNGQLSAHMVNFIEKVNAEVIEDEYGELSIKVGEDHYNLPMPQEPVITKGKMLLSNQKDMKEYLVRLGWNPTVWSDSDLTIDTKKRKVPLEKYKASVYRYCVETQKSDFKKYRLMFAKVKSVKELYTALLKKDTTRPVKVLTSPKYTIDQDKNICPNLEKLGSKVDFVTDVVNWLTYRHRRNSILSPKGTGFLAQPRINIDGRIQTPAITCGASTTRFLHKVVCNIARPTSLYGKPLREMFTVSKGNYQIGCDASGLEARVEAHYAYPYEGGKEYAVALMSEKPNDIHTATGKRLQITRDEAKTLKYAISYGAQPPKVSKQMDWPLSKAKGIFEEFWDNALPLKLLRDRVARYWKTTGRGKFIKAIDGRKLYARSEHSLVNLLFQSCGSIIMKQATVLLDRDLEERGLLFNPFRDESIKGKASQMCLYHDEYQFEVSSSLVQIEVGDEDSLKDYSVVGKRVSDISHVGEECWRGYSEVGESMSAAIKNAAEYYELRVPFDGDYQIGQSWASCH